ncbi:hypothetical protein BDN72DRAFT_907098 [Pluteus cervinus]|uniref:Uncharacterized protein n=1 Tax=Pluteus cervinus TaxID=181527 RepID=A0ACD2ZYC8_9AGAR|nr:hypothetical protein BDN72DRAFT_907098 [Pluteus cervinus]
MGDERDRRDNKKAWWLNGTRSGSSTPFTSTPSTSAFASTSGSLIGSPRYGNFIPAVFSAASSSTTSATSHLVFPTRPAYESGYINDDSDDVPEIISVRIPADQLPEPQHDTDSEGDVEEQLGISTASEHTVVAEHFVDADEDVDTPPPPPPSPSPPPPPPPPPPRRRRKMQSALSPLTFSGDLEEENAQDFLQRFQIFANIERLTDNERAQYFGLHMKAGSTAGRWFLTNVAMAYPALTWTEIVRHFNERWPLRDNQLTPQEYHAELLATELKEEDLLTKVMSEGVQVWAHRAWANKMEKLARDAGIISTPGSIPDVRKCLPKMIQKETRGKDANWMVFLNAVRSIDIMVIREKFEEAEERKKEQAQQTKDLMAAFWDMQLQDNGGNRREQGAGQGGRGRGQGTPVVQAATVGQQPARPRPTMTPTEREELRQVANRLPHHTDNDQGKALYRQQVAAWEREYGTDASQVTIRRPFPLKPGTAPIASGECFNCGKTGHRGDTCLTLRPENAAQRIPEKEAKWRSICNRLFRDRPDRALGVRAVDAEDGQGNGGGLSE